MTEAQHLSLTNEWYTPRVYIEAARQVLIGGIELDTASCEKANKIVNADTFFNKQDDGLNRPWRYGFGMPSVWLNPPYGKTNGKSNAGLWCAKAIEEYDLGNISDAVILVNASTGAGWFQQLWQFPICFTDHRIKFLNSELKPMPSPTKYNAFIYLGNQVGLFKSNFNQFGTVVKKVK